jgi:aryl-alcohol dehydrogenase
VLAGAVRAALLAVPVSFFMLRLKGGEFSIGMWVLTEALHLLVNLEPLIQGETGTSMISLNAYGGSRASRRQLLAVARLDAGAARRDLRPVGDSLAVFGAGSVGLSAVMAAKVVGATTVVAVDVNQGRLALARELGATHTIDGADPDLVARVVEATGGGATFSFDTTGLPAVVRKAVDSLALRGECGIVGAAPLGTEVMLDLVEVMTGGRKFRGIVEGDATPQVFIPVLIDLYMHGRFPFDRLITFYPFDRINDAVGDSETGKVVKPVLRMPE